MYHLSDYDYVLPPERIAQAPCPDRSESRLLHVRKDTGAVSHCRFRDLETILGPDDVLVINNTRVVPARLFGKKRTGGRVEVLIIDYAAGMAALEKSGFFETDCLVRASRRPAAGSVLFFEEGVRAGVVENRGPVTRLRFSGTRDFRGFLDRSGEIPLPPYIRRDNPGRLESDRQDYQTVYADQEGAVAAPTAGLHFTQALMSALEKKGVAFVPLTLHVGYGTFVPVKSEDIRHHEIHSEFFCLPEASADTINAARQQGKRIIAVGTTCVRVLESVSDDRGRVAARTGMCDLFIYPGYRFKAVDALITNFHLPGSTLLMLVSAFYDREKILSVYAGAVNRDYRFFSYGDAMLIE